MILNDYVSTVYIFFIYLFLSLCIKKTYKDDKTRV